MTKVTMGQKGQVQFSENRFTEIGLGKGCLLGKNKNKYVDMKTLSTQG
jgi:hypothetical protein